MKFCDSCGAKNANAAKFCSNCGTRFTEGSAFSGRAGGVFEPDDVDDGISKDDRRGVGFGAGFAAFTRFAARVVKPLLATVLAFIRDMAIRALSPSSTWNRLSPPNFLYWALIQCALLRFPTAIVGIVYAALSNDARKRGALDEAFERAKAARIWLLVDLVLGVAVRLVRWFF